MKLTIKDLKKKDYKKVIEFAKIGMRFDAYLKKDSQMKAYGKYFFYSELEEATQVIACYDNDKICGALLASFYDEKKIHISINKRIYVSFYNCIQHFISKKGGENYQRTNKEMFDDFNKKYKSDGELLFLAVNPNNENHGIGTFLLKELIKREKGKRIHLFTDSNCIYQFYDKRGFERLESRTIPLEFSKGVVNLGCYLYSRVL